MQWVLYNVWLPMGPQKLWIVEDRDDPSTDARGRPAASLAPIARVSTHPSNCDHDHQPPASVDRPPGGGVNQAGRVIGIDAGIYLPSGGSVGIGFAIPSNVASKVVAELREHGKVERGWLGVQMQELTPALAKAVGRPNTRGVLVDEVEPNSPASRADLQQGDIITAFDGTAVKGPQDLAIAVANAKSDTAAKLTVWRDGREQTVPVTIGQQRPVETASAQDDGVKAAPVGMTLDRLTPEIRAELGLKPSARGLYVAEVTAGSRADESGVHRGDVIVRIGNEAVTTPSQASVAIRAAERQKREDIPLLVMRDGTTYYLALQLMTG